MDIHITPRGKILPEFDELPVESNNSVLLSMYFRTAMIDSIRSVELSFLGRTSQLRNADHRSSIEQDLKDAVINSIVSSDFSSDFDISLMSVEIEFDEDDNFSVVGTYGSDNNADSIVHTIEVTAGTMVLGDETEESYSILDPSTTLMTEEIIIREPTNYIELSSEAMGMIAIADYGTEVQELFYVGNTSSILNEHRYSHTIHSDIDSMIEYVGLQNEEEIGDSIFVKSIFPNLKNNSAIMAINDNSGNVTRFTYVDDVQDYLIEMDTSDHVIDIEITFMNVVAKAINTITVDNTDGNVSKHPFPADHIRGPRLANLDKVLMPGVYIATYNALVKPDYDASLLKRY